MHLIRKKLGTVIKRQLKIKLIWMKKTRKLKCKITIRTKKKKGMLSKNKKLTKKGKNYFIVKLPLRIIKNFKC